MARENYSDFLTFASDGKAKAFMEKHKLSVSACGDKMRLLTLVSLGHANMELTYADVAEALRVPPGEVRRLHVKVGQLRKEVERSQQALAKATERTERQPPANEAVLSHRRAVAHVAATILLQKSADPRQRPAAAAALAEDRPPPPPALAG